MADWSSNSCTQTEERHTSRQPTAPEKPCRRSRSSPECCFSRCLQKLLSKYRDRILENTQRRIAERGCLPSMEKWYSGFQDRREPRALLVLPDRGLTACPV